MNRSFIRLLLVGATASMLASQVATASPYASAITNDNGTVRFIINEDGGNVDVVFEDNTTNSMGTLGKGPASFALGSHTSYQIIVSKSGTGVPTLISSDAYTNSVWNSPRGVAVNSNPKIGYQFGRIYSGSSAAGGTVGTTYKGIGIYAMNADQTDALGIGTNAVGSAWFRGSGGAGPWRMRVAPDNTLLVDDFSTAQAALWQYKPDLSDSNLVLSIIGQNAAAAAGIHGDFFGTPTMTGSLADGNLVLWTADSGMGVPAGTTTLGPGTSVGSYNCAFRYDIGAGPLPWNNPPNYAYTMGLDGIAELRTEVDIGKDGKIICGFGRANLSNPDIQILDPTGTTVIWTSWADTGGASDPWRGELSGANTTGGTYAGVRVSPDGRFFASVDINNGITIASLTNGVPDNGSIFGIPNTPTTGNSRGMDWDAADNLYVISSGQGLLRIYSLGNSSTCISSNDWTGTNGTFHYVLPSLTASLAIQQQMASQNYVNNTVNPGAVVPGVFRINLDKNQLAQPVTVNFARSGTATYGVNYTLNTSDTPNGVTISSNSVTFPAGAFPGGGNWNVDVKVIPTATPVSGPTYTVGIKVAGGPSYLAGTPSGGTIYIQNTGPQLLLLTAVNTASTMYRGVTNDYVKFVITRQGDTNGPGNNSLLISPKTYTVTNVSYFGTAQHPGDYKARAQRLDPAGDGVIVLPTDGPTAIIINPGDVAVTCTLGNPVPHTNLGLPPTNVTIIANLTNQVAGPGSTNDLTTSEGYLYNVGTAQVTLTELDNAVGPEVVLWSNPLTNAADSVNWTLTYGATNFGPGRLPLVLHNYNNTNPDPSTNDFLATFGYNPSLDNVGPSVAMANNGWNNVLKMTVNKTLSAAAGVNVYPQGQNFNGNYALRFNMYLSLYQFGLNNPNIGSAAREFALFGVNHSGNQCNWRTYSAGEAVGGMMPTNSDGVWFCIDAGSGGITPADFDALVPGPIPNDANPGATGLADRVSNTAASQNGVFKRPPFDAMNQANPATIAAPGGGEPVNKWVDVSVEITKQTNVSLFINRSPVLASFSLTNLTFAATNGTIMLGYDDPNRDLSDGTAFAMFSNVRVVELSPSIMTHPGLTNTLATSLIVPQFSSLTFTSSATYGTAPITNMWFRGTGTVGTYNTGVPTVLLQSNSVNAASMNDTFTPTFNAAVDGTNYMSVFSDAAGSVTSRVVAVEVVLGPTNTSYTPGVTGNLVCAAVGPVPPTANANNMRWYFNTVSNFATATRIANNNHYAAITNVTRTSTLWLTNLTAADAGFYWCAVTNAAGFVVTPAAKLDVPSAPINVVVAPANRTNLWGSTATFTVTALGSTPFTYQWQRSGTNLTDGGNVSGATTSALSLANVTTADQTAYTAGVTNGLGGAISSAGNLYVSVPPAKLGFMSVSGGNVFLTFTSPNAFDNTNAFILQSSPVVTGPYTNTPATVLSNNTFQITVPQTGDSMFYRLLHVP